MAAAELPGNVRQTEPPVTGANGQPAAQSAVCGLLLLALSLGGPLVAQPGTVEQIIVQGLQRMQPEAFLVALGIREGDPYDVERIQSRFKELWSLRVFEDISIEAETGPQGGTVLIIKVKERPVLNSITYDENKVLTRTQIEDRYKERAIKLDVGKPLDMGSVFFAESAIRDMLAEQGYLDSRVAAAVRRGATETTRTIHFSIVPGGKTRIRKIEFVGNQLFSDRKLKKQLQLTQERRWFWPWSKKNLYHPIKWDQDVSRVRDLYQSHGYLDATLRPPVVELRASAKAAKKRPQEPGAEPLQTAPAADSGEQALPAPPAEPEASADALTAKERKKQEKKQRKADKKARKAQAAAGKRWAYLTVAVTEGTQYRLGEIRLSGNQKFPEKVLRAVIPLRGGDVLNNTALELGVNRITRLYEDQGHLYAAVVRKIQRREGQPVADVEVAIEEDKPYRVARIEFVGNSQTRDRVLRREVQLMEGDLFNRTRLELSKNKINQIGYWQVREDPVIEPLEDSQQVKITFSGEEQGRNEIQIGGGYSGLDGAFFNGVYSTRNFLGRGQILSTALQIGGRSDRYQVSFTEPWFLDRPYLLGVSLFRRDTNFGSTLRSSSDGAGFVMGKRLSTFSRLDLGYSFERVSSTSVALGTDNSPVTFTANNEISSVTPVFAYNTVNNPYRPSRGRSLNFSTQVAGGGLGGDTSYFKPLGAFTAYRRAFGRTFFALNLEAGMVREFGEGSLVSSANIHGIPRFQRFWLGGDTIGPRVFETRTITPRRYVVIDDDGNIIDVLGDPRLVPVEDLVTSGGVPVPIEVGGDRMYLFQSEFVVPLNEQTDVAFFYDMGDSLFEDTQLNFDTVRMSAGVELRFHLPIFPVPLRLIYGIPLRKLEGDRTSNFTFSIGRSF